VASAPRAAAAAVPAAKPRDTLLPWLLLAAFVVLGLIAVAHHEPWRDEADFWLAARDMPLLDILRRGGYVGTPALWTLLLAPFARLGLPYETLGLVNLALASGAAGFVLLAAPFALPLRALIAFSFFFSYEYAVVARSYALGVLLVFAWSWLDARRPPRPLARGLVLALLFNCSVHAMALATPLLWIEAWDWWKGRASASRADRVGLAIAAVGGALAVLQILPPADGQLQGFSAEVSARWARVSLAGALLPSLEQRPVAMVAVALLWIATALELLRRPRALVVLVGASVLLWAIFALKYSGTLRHWGHLLVALIVARWIAAGEESRERAAQGAAGRAAPVRRRGGARALAALTTWGLGAALAWSVFFAWRNWDRDLRYPFSESRAMARYLIDQHLERAPILAWPAPQGSAVLAHLPKRRFWYPGIRDSGSYMRWDRRYEEGMTLSDADLLYRAREVFPGRSDALLLTNRPIAGAEETGFVRIHVAAGEAMMYDERYVLYRREPMP